MISFPSAHSQKHLGGECHKTLLENGWSELLLNSMGLRLTNTLFVISLVFILIFSSSSLAAARSVKVGVYDNFPIVFQDETGEFSGLAVDILKYIAEKEDWDIEYVFGSFEECLKRLDRGEIDVQVYIAYSKERALRYDYTQETLLSNWGVIYTWPGSGIETILDLQGKRVAVMNKSIHAPAFEKLINAFDIKIELVNIDNHKDGLKFIQDKTVDAIVLNRIFGLANAKEFNAEKTNVIFNPIEIRYAMPKGKNADLVVLINKYLKELKSDKQSIFYQSFDSAFGLGVSTSFIPKWIYWAAALIFMVIAILMLLDIGLARLVKIKTQDLENEIEERKKAEQALLRAEKMDSLGKLTGGIAHDFNNMLSIIMGYTELLLLDYGDNPVHKQYLKQIQDASTRSKNMTDKLLSFSKKKNTNAVIANLNELIKSEGEMLTKFLTVGIELKLDLYEPTWPVWLNKSEFQDALLNLSINAQHAMQGHGMLTLKTYPCVLNNSDAKKYGLTAGDYLKLTIIDTGSGMDDKTQAKIFDPFFSTKGDEGTGLGLSQVFGFVQRSNGSISVNSQLGLGTEFILYFPRHQIVDSKSSKEIIDRSDYSGHETLLVVDDEPALRDMLSEILSQSGYQVLTAEDGHHALDILAQHDDIILILSDVIMPNMGGFELADEVAKRYPHIKIQMISGFPDSHQSVNRDSTLFNNMLHKPYKKSELLKNIWQMLNS